MLYLYNISKFDGISTSNIGFSSVCSVELLSIISDGNSRSEKELRKNISISITKNNQKSAIFQKMFVISCTLSINSYSKKS